ncbi:hypothetical protein HAX54_044181, partial [Datura stramonium]|nr:hypothetical protein [Datura stramonium]
NSDDQVLVDNSAEKTTPSNERGICLERGRRRTHEMVTGEKGNKKISGAEEDESLKKKRKRSLKDHRWVVVASQQAPFSNALLHLCHM